MKKMLPLALVLLLTLVLLLALVLPLALVLLHGSRQGLQLAAMALIRALKGMPVEEKESCAQAAWWAALLHQGLMYKFEGSYFLSLGFANHATLCWSLERVGEAHLQLSHVRVMSRRHSNDGALFWMFGHQVQNLDKIKGVQVEILIPALTPDVPNLGPGIVFHIISEQDLIPFCFQSKVPLTGETITCLARHLNMCLVRTLNKKQLTRIWLAKQRWP